MRNYVILNADETDDIVFSEVLENAPANLCWNVAGTQTFVKYEGSKPRFLYGKDTYTHSEIMTILVTSAWTLPDPDEEN